jgi:hypothetical protein
MKTVSVPRVDGSDSLARLGLDEFIVDEETPWLLVLATIGRSKLNKEVRHVGLSTVVSPQGTVTASRSSAYGGLERERWLGAK